MRKQFLCILLFLAILLAVFLMYDTFFQVPYAAVQPEEAMADLTAYDLAQETVRIDEDGWAYYPSRLYGPADFVRDDIDAPEIHRGEDPAAEYGTYRLVVRLPKDQVYGMYGESLANAQRVYIDGLLIDTVGVPGDSKATTTPGTKHYFYSFTPRADETEIIFQAAGFYVPHGGGSHPFFLSAFGNVARLMYTRVVLACLITGCLLALALFYLSLFIFYPKRKQLVYFAMLCALVALRAMMIEDKPLMELVPGISWHMMHALEALDLIGLFACFLLYAGSLTPGLLHRWLVRGLLGVSAVCAVLVVAIEPMRYAAYREWFFGLWFAVFLWVIIKTAGHSIRQRKKSVDTVLIILGFLAFLAGMANDVVLLYYAKEMDGLGKLMFQTGLLLCMFLHMVALALGFARTESAQADARRQAREMRETNLMLDRLEMMRAGFMQSLGHEAMAPLAVMSAHAQLAKAQLAGGADRAEMGRSLDAIAGEARRLAGLMEASLLHGGPQADAGGMPRLDIAPLLVRTVQAQQSIAERHGNRLTITVADALPAVPGDADMLVQVLVNLLANANAHTVDGEIAVAAVREGAQIAVTVADTGKGIDPAVLAHVFDRGRGGGVGESCLGLPVCKTIIDRHGGEIGIRRGAEKGTVVRFTLPMDGGGA